MPKTTRISVDYREFRRDRRYPMPPVVVRIGDRDYPTANWSLGGIQIATGEMSLALGDGVAGTLLMPQTGQSLEFSADVIWTDAEQGTVGVKFTTLPHNAVEILDRYISQWLRRSVR